MLILLLSSKKLVLEGPTQSEAVNHCVSLINTLKKDDWVQTLTSSLNSRSVITNMLKISGPSHSNTEIRSNTFSWCVSGQEFTNNDALMPRLIIRFSPRDSYHMYHCHFVHWGRKKSAPHKSTQLQKTAAKSKRLIRPGRNDAVTCLPSMPSPSPGSCQ